MTDADGDEPTGEDRAAGTLLGTLLGDALAAPYEGTGTAATWEDGAERLARSLRDGGRHFTDDTQMAIALATHLLDRPQVDEPLLGHTFVTHRQRWRGYGPGTLRVLDALEQGAAPSQAARVGFAGGSLGNGAAMRAAPVGARWAWQPERCVDVARRSARPTHVHPEGIDGAAAIAAAVAAAMRGDDPRDAAAAAVRTDRMREALSAAHGLPASSGPREVVTRLGADATAVGSVPTALWIAARADDAEDALVRALAVGGDADTIAAMALAVVGAALGEPALPGEWCDAVEEATWTPAAVADLGRRLARAGGGADPPGQPPA